MTWIIGTPYVFGYGVLIGDVQVTDEDSGETYDAVMKIFPVCRGLIAGFAGNVELGFALIQSLKDDYKFPDDTEKPLWYPEHLAENIPETLQKMYEKISKKTGKKFVHIIIAGVDPRLESDMKVPYCYIFKSDENFSPYRIPRGKIESIGSGSTVTTYVDQLEELQKGKTMAEFSQFEVHNTGGYARMLAHSIGDTLEKNPTQGISPHLFTVIVGTAEEPVVATNDRKYFTDPPIEFKMPEVAFSWMEFKKLINQLSGGTANASACVC